MLDLPQFLANGILCAAAVMVAAFARKDRNELTIVGMAIAANFLFCIMAYTDYAPKYAVQALGFDVSSKELWMLADTLVGMTALALAHNRGWAWIIWAISMGQVLMHTLRAEDLIDEFKYTDVLQIMLLAEITVLLVKGGPGIVEFLHRAFTRRSLRRGASASAFIEQKKAVDQ